MRNIILFSALVLIFLMAVSSCGKKGDPIPPDKITIDSSIEGGRRR